MSRQLQGEADGVTPAGSSLVKRKPAPSTTHPSNLLMPASFSNAGLWSSVRGLATPCSMIMQASFRRCKPTMQAVILLEVAVAFGDFNQIRSATLRSDIVEFSLAHRPRGNF